MPAKLKVFRYADGFHAWTVAASSRPKALAAWGVTRDLFKDGSAQEVTSGKDFDRALVSPGELIETGLKVDVGQIKRVAKPKINAAAQAAVRKLEADLERFDQNQAAELDGLEAERSTLNIRIDRARGDHAKVRDKLRAHLKAARDKA